MPLVFPIKNRVFPSAILCRVTLSSRASPESFSIPMSFHFLTYAIACIMPGVLLTFALPER